MSRYYFVLPAYNEEENIGQLLQSIEKHCSGVGQKFTIIVVNDGSHDSTERISLNFRDGLASKADQPAAYNSLDYLKNEPNKGLGFTLLRGLTRASELCDENDMIVTMDADNTQDPIYVPKMAEAILSGADIAIASRFVGDGGERGLSFFRKFLSQGASLLLRAFFSTSIKDYTSGFRAYRGGFLKKAVDKYGAALVEEKGFSASPEILIKMLKMGANVVEVPFLLKYDLKKGSSKINVPATIVAYLKMIFRFRVRGY